MKAAVLTEANQPLELREIEWPHIGITHGQVLVKVLASGICGAQLQEVRGEKGSHFPRLLGHEACVEVLDCGAGVRNVKPGDRCVAHWRKGCGIESEAPAWRMDGKHYTAGQITTFSTHSIISENRLTRVPNDTPVELCALLGCGLSTALGTMENEANLKIGESVLIIGCGGLGLNLIMAAKLRQAGHIVAADVADKHESAFEMGASCFWNTKTKNEKTKFSQKIIRDFCEDWPYDVVIDTSGDPKAVEMGISKLAPSGRFIMVGQPKPRENVLLTNARHMFDGEGKTIRATQGGGFNPTVDIPRYVAAHRSGLIKLDGLITHRISLVNINLGFDLVRQGQAGRVLIECET